MDEAKMDVYLNKIPREIRHSIKQLNNDKNWAIYLALMFEGRKSFSELREEFGANSNEINRALDALSDGGLISNRIDKMSNIGNQRKYLYYSTNHGRKLLNCLFDTIPTKNVVAKPCATQYKVFSSSVKENRFGDITAKSSLVQNNTSWYSNQLVPQEG
jgi:DNA-binding MarR family transcriptional regulator